MSKLLKTYTSRRFLAFILIFLIITDISILLNIPLLRQALGFTFFSIIPGLLILHILRLNKLGLTERIVLSVGLSLSFLMILGLVIDSLYPLFGGNAPLSTTPLIFFFSVAIVILSIIAYKRNRDGSFTNLPDIKLNTKEKAFLLLPALFPLLSILGMYLMNATSNNVMLIALLFLIPAYGVFIALKHDAVPERIYPAMIFLISISVVLLLGLRSNYVIGVDVHREYGVFQQTLLNGRWQILTNITLDTCLSISILPTIYQSFLNIDSQYLFKTFYPFLFSISPLLVYFISKRYIGSHYAFWASLFFMSQHLFLTAASNPRTVVAILFFALSVTVLYQSGLDEFSKKLLFIIFAVSAILSHYSTAYIFFFILLLTFISMKIIPRIIFPRRKPAPPPNPSTGDDTPGSTSQAGTRQISQPRLRSYITFGTMSIFFVFLFLWYSQITGAPFEVGVNFFVESLESLQEFFILEARSTEVVALLGVELEAKGIPRQIEFVFSWLTIAFIAIGVLTTLVRYRHMVASPSDKMGPPPFLNQKFDLEFFVVSLACSAILVITLALPYVFIGYSMARTYSQMVIILSPFFVIGGIMVAKLLHVKRASLIILLALTPFFMCNTGTMYQIFGTPQAVTLNSSGNTYDTLFIREDEHSAIFWLKDHTHENAIIYADSYSEARSLGQIEMYPIDTVTEGTEPIEEGYIYLRYRGVVDGILMDRYRRWHDISEYQDAFAERNLIYTNDGSQAWR